MVTTTAAQESLPRRLVTGTVVVGVDGSEDAAAALDWALDLAAERQTAVSVLTVLEDPRAVGPWGALSVAADLDDESVATARRQVRHALAEALGRREAGPSPDVLVDVLVGAPADVLVAATPADGQLVVGCRGMGGFQRLLLGSVSDAVAHHARTPVTVVRGGRRHATGAVVVGVDGSAASQQALAYAEQRAREAGAELHVLYAWRPFESPWPPHEPGIVPALAEFEAHAGQGLAELCRDVAPELTVVQRLVREGAGPALIAASSTAGELVVGSRGRGGFAGLLLGSTSAQVVRHASCPVTVVHPSVQG
jgi:nucleotide-binding universal stress UspA family protein